MNLKHLCLILMGIMFLGMWGHFQAWCQNPTGALLYYPINRGNRWTYQQIYQNKVQLKIEVRVGMPEGVFLRLNTYSSQASNEPATYFMKSQFFNENEYGLFLVNEVGYLGDAADFSPPQLWLMADMTPGAAWSWESEEQKRKETTKVSAEPVNVMGKTFDSIVVQTSGTQNNSSYSIKKWYVKNIGPVKQVTVEKGKTVTLELVDYVIKIN